MDEVKFPKKYFRNTVLEPGDKVRIVLEGYVNEPYQTSWLHIANKNTGCVRKEAGIPEEIITKLEVIECKKPKGE